MRHLQTLFLVPPPVYILTRHKQGLPFLHVLANIYLLFFHSKHPNRYEIISHCGFDLHSLLISDVEHFFNVPIGHLPFHTLHGVLKARILKWFAIPFSRGPHSGRPLHHDPSVLGGPAWHGLVSLS